MTCNDNGLELTPPIGLTSVSTDEPIRGDGTPNDPLYLAYDIIGSENSLVVHPGDDLKEVIEAINDSSISNSYVVYVTSGIYSESESITIPPYVTVIGFGNAIINAAGNTGNCIILGPNSFVENISVQGISTGYAFEKTSIGNSVLTSVSAISCKNGLLVNNADAGLTIRGIQLLPFAAPMTNGINITAGNVTANDITIGGAQVLTNGLIATGSDTILTLNGFLSTTDPNVVNAIQLINSSRTSASAINIVAATTGVIMDSGATVVISLNTFNCVTGATIAGDETSVIVNGGNIKDSTEHDIIITDSPTVRFVALNTNTEMTMISPTADMLGAIIDDFEGDKAQKNLGELHVGNPTRPSETVLGEGDSYVNGMMVYTYDGTDYVDVTTAAKSFSGSTFAFPNVNVNSAIYFTSVLPNSTNTDTVKHHGLKLSIDTAQVDGTIVLEYYNGSSWVEFPGMTTDGDSPYYPYAENYFNNLGSVQIRYDINMVNDNWIKNDLPLVGDDYYWVRARISSALTTAPILQQSKIHSARFEANRDGWVEYFGNARPKGNLPISVAAMRAFEGNMQNDTIWFDQFVGSRYPDGRFTTPGDKTGTIFELPIDTDTSCPVTIRFSVHPITTNTLTYNVRITKVSPGDTTYEAAPGAPSANLQTINVSVAATAGVQEIFEASFDISKFIARREGGNGDKIAISIESTTANDSVLTDLTVEDYKWSTGGHVG